MTTPNSKDYTQPHQYAEPQPQQSASGNPKLPALPTEPMKGIFPYSAHPEAVPSATEEAAETMRRKLHDVTEHVAGWSAAKRENAEAIMYAPSLAQIHAASPIADTATRDAEPDECPNCGARGDDRCHGTEGQARFVPRHKSRPRLGDSTPLLWEYQGDGLVLFWRNPYNNDAKETVAMMMWPSHAPEKTEEIEQLYERMASTFVCAWNGQPSTPEAALPTPTTTSACSSGNRMPGPRTSGS